MESTLATEYRRARKPHTGCALDTGRPYLVVAPAHGALAVARDELALREAESAGRIRFRWEPDELYSPADSWGLDEPEQSRAVAWESERLADGRLVAEGCIAEVPRSCPHCDGELADEWEHVASLWGIVHESGDEYAREVERELAREAGVIA